MLIFGSDEDLPLLEDIAVEVRKRGASPLVSVATEQLDRRLYDEVPAKYDSHEPEMMAKLAGIVDVIINTEAGEGRTLEGVPAERIAARATGVRAVPGRSCRSAEYAQSRSVTASIPARSAPSSSVSHGKNWPT